MVRKHRHDDDAEHMPGENDGLSSNPVVIARYERKRAETRRLQVEALELRKAGYSYRRIGEIQNCKASTAANRVTNAIQREVPRELVDSTRAIELERLDAMTKICQEVMAQAVAKGDTETYFKAQDRWNAIHDRRARIVPIQEPTKLVIDQQGAVQNDQDRELTEIIGKRADEMKAQIDSLNQMHNRVYG